MNQDENSPWQYKPDGSPAGDLEQDNSAPPPAAMPPAQKSVAWQAPEFIEHIHGPGWYASLLLITAAVAAAVYFSTGEYFATVTIVVVGVIVGVFAGHKPQPVQYEISSSGLAVNDKNYPYNSFKSFAVMREGPLNSINLYPLKRFMPPVSAYFQPADEKKIVEALGDYLPYEERKMEGIDRLSRRLRF